ncbi:MAG: MopE-related protein [Myxococcota bacterium]
MSMRRWAVILAAACAGWFSASPALAQSVPQSLADFTQLALQGVTLNNPTTVNVGADGKIYVTQQNGLIAVLTVSRQFSTVGNVQVETWQVTGRYDINVVQNMPNHDDQGRYEANVNNRQVTGAVTTTDAFGNVMLYVTSSDPRVAVGTDTNLDTNSGVVSRVQMQVDAMGAPMLDSNGDPMWERLDLVRGFPKSEENHSINGLELVTKPNGDQILLVAIGGSTNAGAQGNNFAYTPEYFYSGSVVSIDLEALDIIEQAGPSTYVPAPGDVHEYLFDLPTLNDPTRLDDTNGGDLDGSGVATADVFGGNDGLNQAIFDTTGVVELYGVGYRNQYDVTVAANNDVYTCDNGSNGGWGGVPLNALGAEITDANNDGLADNGPAVNLSNESGQVNKGDQLHRVGSGFTIPAYDQSLYGGHPNLYRARGIAAGVYLYAANNNPYGVATGTPLDIVNGSIVTTALPVDVGPLILNGGDLTGFDTLGAAHIDLRQEVFKAPARQTGIKNGPDGSLYSFNTSTNGIDEYTAAGGLQNALLTVSFSGQITALTLDANGDVDTVEARSLTSNPLDVKAQGPSDPFPGVIFVAAYGADQIVILSPDQGQGVNPNPNDRDVDGLDDTFDPFPVDPYNGYVDLVRAGDTFVWDFSLSANSTPPNDSPAWYDGTGGLYNGGGIGFTGVMTNRQGLPETLTDLQNVIYGGAPGILQVKAVDEGTPGANTQRNGFQFGINPVSTLTNFDVTTNIDNFLDEISNLPANAEARQGLFVGAGDQDNYVSVSLVRRSNGDLGFEVESQFAFAFVGATTPTIDWYPVAGLSGVTATDTVTLGLDVDRVTGMVTPHWTYEINGVSTTGTGLDVGLTGDAWDALQGVLMLPTDTGALLQTGFAVGVLSSVTNGQGQTFEADFDDIAISGFGQGQGALVTAVNAGGLAYTALDGTVFSEDMFMNGNTASTTAAIAGTDDDALYQVERWAPGGFTYDVPVNNGSYLVQMHFVESYAPNFTVGGRVFDVELEGTKVLDDFDIFAEAGAETALIKTFIVSVADGMLTLTTTPEIENPQISAFAIYDFVLDNQAPSIAVSYDPPVFFDDPLDVTVTFTDDQQLDPSSIDLSDVTFSSTGQALQILNQQLVVSGSGGQAYAEYSVRPIGGWANDTITVDVAASAFNDAAGNDNAAFTNSDFTFAGTPNPLVLAVNAGGPQVVAQSGRVYQADNFNNGMMFSTGRPMAGTDDDGLYQSERFQAGGFTYDVAVPNGLYTVEMEFAEIFNQITMPGQRVFDVLLEGQVVVDNLDIFAEVGAIDTALTVTRTIRVTDGSLTLSTVGVVQNPKISAFAILRSPLAETPATDAFFDPGVVTLIDTTDPLGGIGEALVQITPNVSDVQSSNFGNNSFTIQNTGTKRIAAVYLDVTGAVFPDSVFDSDGTGGDHVTKALTFSTGAADVLPIDPAVTAYPNLSLPARSISFDPLDAFNPNLLTDEDNLFVDEVSNNSLPSPKAGGGFRGQLLLFTGFDAGETIGFSSDMDPNSIAGLLKGTVDTASNQVGSTSNFDVGGISGAELTGSLITILFGDGTIASAQLGHDGSQAGAQTVVSTIALQPAPTADVQVDGFLPGDVGVYGVDVPEVIVTGTPGDTVRISLAKGIDPVGNSATVATGQITIDSLVDSRLNTLYPAFPVNNAAEWQHIDVVIPASGLIDITYGVGAQSFDYSGVAANGGFTGDDVLPLAYVAAVIDAQGRPVGPVSEPIYLLNQGGAAICEDQDADGVTTCDNDCNDLDPLVNPSATEVCDAIDNDCDGTADGGTAIDALTWYADGDGDGFGDIDVTALDCVQPMGFVADATDCDDLIASINPDGIEICNGLDDNCNNNIDGSEATDATPFYADTDGDGFGDATDEVFDCAAPTGFVANNTDCNDGDVDINPGEAELCDGFDNNCDGDTDDASSIDALTYYEDLDGDLYGNAAMSQNSCSPVAGFVLDSTDCDDGAAAVNPGAIEVCDSIDNDCNGSIDPSTSADATTYYADTDDDGFGNLAVPQDACSQPLGFVLDSTDCDDVRSFVFPGAPEVCDSFDNDCNGTTDGPLSVDASTWYADADADGFGNPAVSQLECVQPSGFVSDNRDCDDGAAAVNPDATEMCDSIDNNCDMMIDDPSSSDASTWYADTDADGFGNAAVNQLACTQPSGFVSDDRDCDDGAAAVNPDATEVCDSIDNNCDATIDEPTASDASTWYADTDADGFGNAAVNQIACNQPSGFVSDSRDCDDGAAAVNPDATEVCDSIDNNCDATIDEPTASDASTWYADTDADGFGNAAVNQLACNQPSGFVADNRDCDDGAAAVNPDATEVCDSIDNNCDATIDEPTASDASTWYADTDADGFGNAAVNQIACNQPGGFVANNTDCDDGAAAVNPDATEVCNAIDDNCDTMIDDASSADASTWYADADSDGYGDADTTERACSQPGGFVANAEDCNDAAGAVNPGADEVCGNAIDDDCDLQVDDPSAIDASRWYADNDEDTYGDATDFQVACEAPDGFVANSTDCDDAVSAVNPGATEVCNDIDDNCDTTIDEPSASDAGTWYRDADNDGYGNSALSERACVQPAGFVSDDTDCNDGRAATNPGAEEFCNTFDDDCDGTADEDDAIDAGTYYADTDSDGFGDGTTTVRACAQPADFVTVAGDCDDTRSAVNPDGTESCNGLDDNCDGSTDGIDAIDALTYYADVDGDAFGDPALSQQACAQPSGFVANDGDCNDGSAAVNPNAAEVCNSIDDDCNGDIDVVAVVNPPTWYADADLDGYGDPNATLAQCDQPAGYIAAAGDCDDTLELVNPGQAEVCDANDIDENCNGEAEEAGALGEQTFYVDADADGFGDAEVLACDLVPGLATDAGDCNDEDDVVFPGAPEDCSDRRDTNCDGASGDDDLDNDGFAVCDECDDTDAQRNPGAEEVCDGIDNNCDDAVDNDAVDAEAFYVDADGDGFGDAEVLACDQPDGTVTVDGDCDDAAADVNPDGVEVAEDGIDQNCDGVDGEAEGCGGCSTNGSPSFAWLALAGLGVLLRRRRA